ncbi:hypothetical protein QUB75_21015 [Microcoleus sp. K1-B6]
MTAFMLTSREHPNEAFTGVQAGELEARYIGFAVRDGGTPRKRF